MIASRRRTLAAAAATLASALLPRKPARAADLPDLGRLQETPGGTPLPDLQWKLPDGTVRTIADHAGQGVVLNLWATWCVPCVAEMPALDALANTIGADIVVLPLSSDRGGAAAVERFYRERGVAHLPVLLDPTGAAARALGVRGIPTTLVIDRAGRERARMEGAADWNSGPSIATIRRLVGPAPATTERPQPI